MLIEVAPGRGGTKIKGALELGSSGSYIQAQHAMNVETTYGTLTLQSLGVVPGDYGVEIKSTANTDIMIDPAGTGSIILGNAGYDLELAR